MVVYVNEAQNNRHLTGCE